MKLNPTTGIATVSQELNAVVNISAIRIEQIADFDYVLANHKNIVQQGNDNAIIIADSLNTYQQCGKLPSELLATNELLVSKLKQCEQDFMHLGNVGAAYEINNLLTKLKAE